MATVRVTGSWSRAHERLRKLAAKLENPRELTTRLARDLHDELIANAPVGQFLGGTLKKGLEWWQVTTDRHASLGDPNVLGDWQAKPPRGTIGEFVKWLREQNRLRRNARQERSLARKNARTARREARVAAALSRKTARARATAGRYPVFKKWVERMALQPDKFASRLEDFDKYKVFLRRRTVKVPGRGHVIFSYAEQRKEATRIVLGLWKAGRIKTRDYETVTEEIQYLFRSARWQKKNYPIGLQRTKKK